MGPNKFRPSGPSMEQPKSGTNNIPYRCTECNEVFSQAHPLFVHLRRHILADRFKCSICAVIFHDKGIFKRHMLRHTSKSSNGCDKMDILKCSLCSKVFDNEQGLTLHVIRIHVKQEIFSCTVCKKEFVSPRRLYKHVWSHVMGGTVKLEKRAASNLSTAKVKTSLVKTVPLKKVSEGDQDQRQNHVGDLKDKISALCRDLMVENQDGYLHQAKFSYALEELLGVELRKLKCEDTLKECLKVAPIFEERKAPPNSQPPKTWLRCPRCFLSFKKMNYLMNHLKYKHNDTQNVSAEIVSKNPAQAAPVEGKHFSCNFCLKVFGSIHALNSHQRIHRPKSSSSLNEGSKKLWIQKTLDSYTEETSVDLKPQVDSAFAAAPVLKGQSACDTKQNNFEGKKTCNLCNRQFEKNRGFLIHMSRVHGPFVKSSNLNKRKPQVNLKKYSRWRKWALPANYEERRYPCSVCPWRFLSASHLEDHMWSIHVNKTFTCSKCGKLFKVPRILKNHRRDCNGGL